jgi:A/G-specific adenine glycosylase
LEFRKRLLVWYTENGRNFPWRQGSTSKYKLVVSEILLQRTRAETVASFFNTFFSQYPSWKKLAEADEAEIGQVIRPMGLWKRRALTLMQLATVMAKRNGRFPRTRAEIEETLPGVGQYIANAIFLLCHGEPQPLLDANMARVLERVFGPRKLSDIRYDPYLQALAFEIVQCKEAKKLNWAILDLAASNCLPRKLRCTTCPLKPVCSEALPKNDGV